MDKSKRLFLPSEESVTRKASYRDRENNGTVNYRIRLLCIVDYQKLTDILLLRDKNNKKLMNNLAGKKEDSDELPVFRINHEYKLR